MLSNLINFSSAIFRGKVREQQRADFEAVSTQWEQLVEKLQAQIDAQCQRIVDLEIKLRTVQDEAEKCLRQRITDIRRIGELELKVDRLESLMRGSSGEHHLDVKGQQ